MIDFSALSRPWSPNTALFADGGDTRSRADRPAPHFADAPPAVIAAWDAVARSEPRTGIVAFDAAAGRHHAVQRSRVLRLPDDIFAEARAYGTGSRLLLYSASRFGKGDLGVNRRRLDRWLSALAERLQRR